MTDPDKPTLAECIFCTNARYVGGKMSGSDMAAVDLAILSHLRTLQGVEAGTHVVVPVEPPREMWSGLARDLMMWQDMGNPSGAALYRHLKMLGITPPDWLLGEIPDTDHAPSKGNRVVAIYRAMISARPGAPE